ncbi:MAG: hypothetical protein WAV90_22770 [Gordonia amarae]
MNTIQGMPIHPLIAHLAVVSIPFAALTDIVAVSWPRARRWLGWGAVAITLVAVIVTPLTTSAGESLEKTTPMNSDLARHVHLGDQMVYWVAGLFAAITVHWAATADLSRWKWVPEVPDRWRELARLVTTLTVIVLALGAIVWVIRIGDAGAKSVWLG